MLTIAKLLMRGAALAITLLVFWAAHVFRPDVNMLEAVAAFFVLWMAFTFAVVLLASSWVIGRAGNSFKFGRNAPPPTNAQVEALNKKMRAMCEWCGCKEYREPNSRYCIAHKGEQVKGGAR